MLTSLSTRLKGVDVAATRMHAPLADLGDNVAALRAAASAALTALRAGLEQHGASMQACELLELLLGTSHIVYALVTKVGGFLLQEEACRAL